MKRFLLLLAFTSFASSAFATDFTVKETGDPTPRVGACVANPAQCSLREAVIAANGAGAGHHRIILQADTVYTPTIKDVAADEDMSQTGDLDLRNDIEILAQGKPATISGINSFRIFHVISGPTILSNLIIENGRTTASSLRGGGMLVSGGDVTLNNIKFQHNSTTTGGEGGGIANEGSSLTLNNCVVEENSAIQSAGGIFSKSTLTLNNSTVDRNHAPFEVGGILISAGEAKINHSVIENNYQDKNSPNPALAVLNNIQVSSGGKLSLEKTTITSNALNLASCLTIVNQGELNIVASTIKGTGVCSNPTSKALLNSGTAILTLQNSTISGHKESLTVDSSDAKVQMNQSTIVASNSADPTINVSVAPKDPNSLTIKNSLIQGDCNSNRFKSLGNNIAKGPNCGTGFTQVDPKIDSLKENGGATSTHALQPGSPAIDAGDCTGLVNPTDQRGIARPKGNACDIGSYEAVEASKIFTFQPKNPIIFPDTQVGKHSPLNITLTNAGELEVLIPNVAIALDPTFKLNFADCVGKTLAPTARCTITGDFTPPSTGDFTLSIGIPNNISNDLLTVVAKGKGTLNPPTFPSLTLSEIELKFPITKPNATSTKTLTITNSGQSTLVVNDIVKEGNQKDDFIFTGCAGANLAAQASCDVTVSFSPKAEGSSKAQLKITTNAPNGVASVSLSGSTSTTTSEDPLPPPGGGSGGCALSNFAGQASPSLLFGFSGFTALLWVRMQRKKERKKERKKK